MAENPTPFAIASAKPGSIKETLADDIVRRLVYDYLIKHVDPSPEHVGTPSGVMFRASGASVICNRGEVTVETGPFRHKEATLWKMEIHKLLDRAAGLVYQQQVKNVIASNHRVVQEQKSSNGILLVMAEIVSGNTAVDSRIAIFPNGRVAVFVDDGSMGGAKETITQFLLQLKKEGLVRDFSMTNQD